jgi:predicted flap endonuclease-1-like 5' DNA nuclease
MLFIEERGGIIMPKGDKKKGFRIHGKVIVKETGIGIPDLRVKAFDKDILFDDPLGKVVTDRNGIFDIRYGKKEFKDLGIGKRPNIYVTVAERSGKEIYSSKQWIRRKAKDEERFLIKIPKRSLRRVPRPVVKAAPKPVKKAEPKAKPKAKPKKTGKKKKVGKGIALEELPGIGPKRGDKLRAKGIKDVQAFAKADNEKLKKILGKTDIKKMKRECDKLLKKKKK